MLLGCLIYQMDNNALPATLDKLIGAGVKDKKLLNYTDIATLKEMPWKYSPKGVGALKGSPVLISGPKNLDGKVLAGLGDGSVRYVDPKDIAPAASAKDK